LDVKVGWISQPGEIIVCLPNKLIISINGEVNNGIDGGTFENQKSSVKRFTLPTVVRENRI
jgi:hypothetical protein